MAVGAFCARGGARQVFDCSRRSRDPSSRLRSCRWYMRNFSGRYFDHRVTMTSARNIPGRGCVGPGAARCGYSVAVASGATRCAPRTIWPRTHKHAPRFACLPVTRVPSLRPCVRSADRYPVCGSSSGSDEAAGAAAAKMIRKPSRPPRPPLPPRYQSRQWRRATRLSRCHESQRRDPVFCTRV